MGADKQSARSSPSLKQPSCSLGLRLPRLFVAEKRVEDWFHSDELGKGEFRCLSGPAPLRREHRAHLDVPGTESVADPPGLNTPIFIKIALGRAVAQAHAGRIAHSRRVRVPKERNCSGAERVPGRFIGCRAGAWTRESQGAQEQGK